MRIRLTTRHLKTVRLVAMLVALATAACGKPVPEPTSADAMHPLAQRKWVSLCANCHAPDGSGRGPGSKTLNPRPRDFRDEAWQASVSDQHLEQVITKGGAKMGLSRDMPPNPDLITKPRVTADLIRKIRSFRGTGEETP